MPFPLTRRGFLFGTTALLLPLAHARAAVAPTAGSSSEAGKRFAAIEKRNGGRLGAIVLDTGSGAHIEHRPDERFAMCSTFKFLLAAAVLERADRGEERLDRRIAFGQSDLEAYAPVAKTHLATGGMTVSNLCAAMVEWSDNTAANLLLKTIGGPEGLTRYARALGDPVTRLDRTEPTLNTAISGDERDTTTPRMMLQDMKSILLGNRLSDPSRTSLETWLIGCKTSAKRLRAGLPSAWRVGDKTGSGDNGTANDVAILWPPGRAAILASVYYTGSSASADARDAVHAEVARIIADTF
jgi:beta-lactamase class A